MSDIKSRKEYYRRMVEPFDPQKSNSDETSKDEMDQMLQELHGKKPAAKDANEANDVGLIDASDPKEYAHRVFEALLDKIEI
jgi:precorrin-3B methylase